MYFFNVFSLWLIILTHDYDSLYFFCLFIFIGHYWLKSIFIGETNICVYLKITSSASSFNNPIYESFIWLIWFLSLVLDLALYYAPTLNA